jgi:hypothetical protein
LSKSYERETKAVTVRVPETLFGKLMRQRKVKTRSGPINILLAEEKAQLHAHKVLRRTAGTVRSSSINARLL